MRVLALTGTLAAGNLVSMGLRVAAGLLTARCLDPGVLGRFNSIALVQGYLVFAQGGVLNGLNRELPYWVGRNDVSRVRRLVAAAQSWALAVAWVIAATLLGLAAWRWHRGDPWGAAGWATNAALGWVLIYAGTFLQMTYRTRGDFVWLAIVGVGQNAVSLAAVLLVAWYSYYGLCFRALAVAATQLALLWLWRPVKVRPAWHWAEYKHLFRIGAPIFLVGILYSWWPTLDSTLVLGKLGTQALGLYALPALVSTGLQLVPDSLSQVIYPAMAEKYGAGSSIPEILRMALRPVGKCLAATVPLAIAGWWGLPWLLQHFLPKYLAAARAGQMALLAPCAMCFSPPSNIFNVVGRQGRFAAAILLGILGYYVTLEALLNAHFGLKAFPTAMFAGRLIYLAAAYVGIFHLVLRPPRPLNG